MAFQYDLKKANAEALEYVRKELLDIFNRLHSILEDVRFVDQVHKAYPDLPMLRTFLTLRPLHCAHLAYLNASLTF